MHNERSRRVAKGGKAGMKKSRAADDNELKPDASAEEVLDAGLRETFPASDPVSVQRTYRRKVRKAAAARARR